MQLDFYPTLSLIIIVHAVFLQGVWLFMARRARDIYFRDIMNFRSPTSTLSRFYDWRMTISSNALIEGLVFQVILVGSLVGISIALVNLAAFFDVILYVLFVMVLSFLSSLQTAWRVKEINDQERYLVTSIGKSTDKIGVTRDLIENLILQGAAGDGRVWLALYRLSQKPDKVGWAIRDVLIEKGRELREMNQYQPQDSDSPDNGPGVS